MSEQRREAHRGLAGLNQTWVAAIARARSRVRYMALCRRLLEVGMRPPGASTLGEPSWTSSHTEISHLSTAAVSHARASPGIRRTASAVDPKADSPSLPEVSSSRASDGGSGRGRGGGRGSGGDLAAELRRFANQIRCGGRRKPPTGRLLTPERRKSLEVRGSPM